jgi:hypothetical protein
MNHTSAQARGDDRGGDAWLDDRSWRFFGWMFQNLFHT